MKRFAITTLIIALSLAVGVMLGYQIQNSSTYSNTAVTSSHGFSYEQHTYETINSEINTKIDSLFGPDVHKEIIIQVIPSYGGYSVEARILNRSVLAKQDALDSLNNWISERMTELQLNSSIEAIE